MCVHVSSVGYADTHAKFKKHYDMIGELSGLKPSEKPTSITTTTAPSKSSNVSKPNPKDGVYTKAPKAPLQKCVGPKLNHLPNPLDTLPNTSRKHPPKQQHTHPRVSNIPRR